MKAKITTPKGLSRANETQSTKQEINCKNPNSPEANQFAVYASAAEKLNQGLPGPNSRSGENKSLIRNVRISMEAPKLLSPHELMYTPS